MADRKPSSGCDHGHRSFSVDFGAGHLVYPEEHDEVCCTDKPVTIQVKNAEVVGKRREFARAIFAVGIGLIVRGSRVGATRNADAQIFARTII